MQIQGAAAKAVAAGTSPGAGQTPSARVADAMVQLQAALQEEQEASAAHHREDHFHTEEREPQVAAAAARLQAQLREVLAGCAASMSLPHPATLVAATRTGPASSHGPPSAFLQAQPTNGQTRQGASSQSHVRWRPPALRANDPVATPTVRVLSEPTACHVGNRGTSWHAESPKTRATNGEGEALGPRSVRGSAMSDRVNDTAMATQEDFARMRGGSSEVVAELCCAQQTYKRVSGGSPTGTGGSLRATSCGKRNPLAKYWDAKPCSELVDMHKVTNLSLLMSPMVYMGHLLQCPCNHTTADRPS